MANAAHGSFSKLVDPSIDPHISVIILIIATPERYPPTCGSERCGTDTWQLQRRWGLSKNEGDLKGKYRVMGGCIGFRVSQN